MRSNVFQKAQLSSRCSDYLKTPSIINIWQKHFHFHAFSLSSSQCPLFCLACTFSLPKNVININKCSPWHQQGLCRGNRLGMCNGETWIRPELWCGLWSVSGKRNKQQSILTGKSRAKLILMRTCQWTAEGVWKGCTPHTKKWFLISLSSLSRACSVWHVWGHKVTWVLVLTLQNCWA